MSRVPRKIDDFNNYIRITDDYLQVEVDPGPPPVLNWGRLGLTQEDADQWHALREAWENDLFPRYVNPNTKTKTVNAQITTAMEIFRTFAQPMIDIMAASPNANQDDAEILNFKLVRSEPTHPTVPIADLCYADVLPLGGGAVRISCRTIHDAKRASMAKGANLIQVAMKIDGPAPTGPSDGTSMVILGKANEIYNIGDDHTGKRAYAYFRWYNTKYPHLAGPYSQVVSFIVP